MNNLEPLKDSKKSTLIDILMAVSCFEPTLAAVTGALKLGHGYHENKKLNKWMDSVTETVNELSVDVESLRNNEEFTESLYLTSRIALISDQDKQKSLINIIKNTLDGQSIEMDKRLHFFEILTYMNNSKIKVLRFLDNPQVNISNIHSSGLYSFLLNKHEEFKNQEDFLNSILFDLENKGLVPEGIRKSLKQSTTAQALNDSRTTKLGKEFIEFIS